MRSGDRGDCPAERITTRTGSASAAAAFVTGPSGPREGGQRAEQARHRAQEPLHRRTLPADTVSLRVRTRYRYATSHGTSRGREHERQRIHAADHRGVQVAGRLVRDRVGSRGSGGGACRARRAVRAEPGASRGSDGSRSRTRCDGCSARSRSTFVGSGNTSGSMSATAHTTRSSSPAFDLDAVELEVGGGVAAAGHHRRHHTHELLDRLREQPGVGDEPVAFSGWRASQSTMHDSDAVTVSSPASTSRNVMSMTSSRVSRCPSTSAVRNPPIRSSRGSGSPRDGRARRRGTR